MTKRAAVWVAIVVALLVIGGLVWLISQLGVGSGGGGGAGY